MDFYNNWEEDCYAIQYNDRLQLIQWSNTTTSCISIDLIAKLSPRIQCVSVIVPFGFYRIDCMILSIDWNTVCFSDCSIWILSNRLHDIIHRLDIINESFYRLFIIDNWKIPKKILIMSNGWIIIINLILIDRSYPVILFMIHNTKEINGIQYDYKTNK